MNSLAQKKIEIIPVSISLQSLLSSVSSRCCVSISISVSTFIEHAHTYCMRFYDWILSFLSNTSCIVKILCLVYLMKHGMSLNACMLLALEQGFINWNHNFKTWNTGVLPYIITFFHNGKGIAQLALAREMSVMMNILGCSSCWRVCIPWYFIENSCRSHWHWRSLLSVTYAWGRLNKSGIVENEQPTREQNQNYITKNVSQRDHTMNRPNHQSITYSWQQRTCCFLVQTRRELFIGLAANQAMDLALKRCDWDGKDALVSANLKEKRNR